MPAGSRDAHLRCVVPVAGLGTRMLPLTRGRPKPLLDLAGRSIIDRLIERIAEVADEICLVVNPRSDALRRELGSSLHGASLLFAEQAELRGVADAVLQARDPLGNEGPFLVVMGDCYYENSLLPAVQTWRRSGAPGAVIVEPVRAPASGPMGLVDVRAGRVAGIEKRDFRGDAKHRVAGAVVLPQRGFEACAAVGAAGTGEAELEDAVAWLMEKGVEFTAVPYDGWRRNINEPEDLREVTERIERGDPPRTAS